MAVITIEKEPVAEESSPPIVITFTDPDGTAVTPNAGTVTWTLTDSSGNIINERSRVTLTSAASITLVLTADDMTLQAGETSRKIRRELLIEYEYDCVYGNDIKDKGLLKFSIENIAALPIAS